MFDTKVNCPHCGAPINSVVCPYCGTRFIDFANIETNEPAYLRVKWEQNKIAVFKALPETLTFRTEKDGLPIFTVEFCILPDKDESGQEIYMKILERQD